MVSQVLTVRSVIGERFVLAFRGTERRGGISTD